MCTFEDIGEEVYEEMINQNSYWNVVKREEEAQEEYYNYIEEDYEDDCEDDF